MCIIMNWLDKLERKFGRFAIPNLMSYIIFSNAVIFLLYNLNPLLGNSIIFKLAFIPHLVFQGEVWRLITFIFIPRNTGILWGIISLILYYGIGTELENQWGTFKFNVYYLIGMIGIIISSLLFNVAGVPTYLNLSLFLAFAKLYGETEFRIYFLIPVKAKYLGWLSLGLASYSAISSGWGGIILLTVSLANYLLFFGRSNINSLRSNKNVKQKRRKFKDDRPKVIHIHRCTVCGVTDRDNPSMEFRYCSQCDGHYEYCADHIFDHDHK